MSDAGSGQGGGYGWFTPLDGGLDYSRAAFQVRMLMTQLRTMTPVKVIKVLKQDGKTPAVQGEVAGAGYVQVQPLVSMVDGNNQAIQHGTIYNIPYTRMYGGQNAIIHDPLKNDIGWLQVADRDISAFKQNAAQQNSQGSSGGGGGFGGVGGALQSGQSSANPGSTRRFDLADGIYVGGVLNATPKQYLTYTSTGIQIQDKNKNTITMDNSSASNSNTGVNFGSGSATGASATNTNTGIQGIQHADMNQNLLQMLPKQFNMISTLASTIMSRQNSASSGSITDSASGSNGTYSCNATTSITDTAQNINHNGITGITGAINIGTASNLISSSNITAVDIFGTINPPSDGRIKSHQKAFKNALDLLMQLKVKSYIQTPSSIQEGKLVPHLVDPVNGKPYYRRPFKSFGVIAQECREILPEVVKGDEETELLSVEEPKLGILALAALQEYVVAATKEIAELKQRISELERK